MTAAEVKKELKEAAGGAMFITLKELTKFVGFAPASTKAVKKRYLKGCVAVGDGYYFIPDIVPNIMAARKVR